VRADPRAERGPGCGRVCDLPLEADEAAVLRILEDEGLAPLHVPAPAERAAGLHARQRVRGRRRREAVRRAEDADGRRQRRHHAESQISLSTPWPRCSLGSVANGVGASKVFSRPRAMEARMRTLGALLACLAVLVPPATAGDATGAFAPYE